MFGNTSFKSNVFENAPKFSSPQEEIDFLKSQIEQKEKMLASLETTPSKQEIARTLVHEYSKEEAENLLHKAHPYYADRERGVSLPLSPEKDDEKIAEFKSKTSGVYNKFDADYFGEDLVGQIKKH
jgi:hypothetical protein